MTHESEPKKGLARLRRLAGKAKNALSRRMRRPLQFETTAAEPADLVTPDSRDLPFLSGPARTLAASPTVKPIAYYLPQFHPIPENDQWWGKGFTEWTNVVRGRPFFPGHYQPHLPGELAFYDLRVAEVREQQAKLAREHGIHGFCYYYYWFNGKRLLERPLDEVVRTGKPDFPFCICWANENWSRRWDGAEAEVLMAQVHSEESDQAFIHDVIPILQDPRYIRVNGAPMLLVYRPGILPNAQRTAETWREACRKAGIPNLHLAAVQSFGLTDPRPFGFDSAVEFPPHGLQAAEITRAVEGLDPSFTGKIYDFRDAVKSAIAQAPAPYRLFRGAMTGWDNTARRRHNGHVFANSSPTEYEVWLRALVSATEETHPPGERFLFINAWNEWAEGTHLEPDQKHGRGYLEATARALSHRSDWRAVIGAIEARTDVPEAVRGYLRDLEFALEAYARSVSYLTGISDVVRRIQAETHTALFSGTVPLGLQNRPVHADGVMHLDTVQGNPARGQITLRRSTRTPLEGWAFAPGVEIGRGGTSSWLLLRNPRGKEAFFAPLLHRTPRQDVALHHPQVDARFTGHAGFSATIWCKQVPPGEYEMGVVQANRERAVAAFWGARVTVE